jgi:ATP sulfurylase
MSTRSTNDAIRLICTLGPASFAPRVLRQLDDIGVDLLRINMSHTSVGDLRGLVRKIRKTTKTPLCIDTEGAQVRTGAFKSGVVELKTGAEVTLTRGTKIGNPRQIPINPPEAFTALAAGMLLSLDFNAVLLLVIKKERGGWLARVLCGGPVGSNKGVSVDRDIPLPPMTRKDIAALKIARAEGIRHVAFSFAHSAEAVNAVRKALPRSIIISKIETRGGIQSATEIMKASDAVLIDRGDMSREVAIEHVPFMQKRLTRMAREQKTPIYVATNLLESMITSPHPTRAEVNDMASTLLDGANGLVLAAETAIGRYPARCARMVQRLIDEFVSGSWKSGKLSSEWLGNGILENRIAPNGGSLIQRHDYDAKIPRAAVRLRVSTSTVRDLQQISDGVYSPLTGFMNREEIRSVLQDYRLPDGSPWSLPIVLPVPAAQIRFNKGDTIILEAEDSGRPVALMSVSDIYSYNANTLTRQWFGTTDRKHPGVRRLLESGDRLIGGAITLIERTSFAPLEHSLTPAQTRAIFAHNGWDKVVGFHTRNAPHRAHEFIQLKALERVGADGLFIHPALGRKKAGDFSAKAILTAYSSHIQCLPPGRAVLSGFFSDSWYAGPREAVFTALCRKNFGCSHFIVGRDHTGVGNFYKPDAAQKLFDKLGDIGISPIFFDAVGYSSKARGYREAPNGAAADLRKISGTQVRELLTSGKRPPEWVMRKEVSKALLSLRASGKHVFEL